VIVAPHGKSKNQEDHGRKEDVHLQGKSSHRWRTGSDEKDVTEKGDDRNARRPKYEPYVRPLSWWTENLRQLCPVNALRDCFADDQTWTFVTEQKRTEASSVVHVTDVLLVGEGDPL